MSSVTTQPAREVAKELVDVLGSTLVAYIAGTRRRTEPEEWANGESQPDALQELKLHAALEVLTPVRVQEGDDIARAWFIGQNVPDGITGVLSYPATVLHDAGTPEELETAKEEVSASAHRLIDGV
jgi:hypothetical protein